MTFDDWVSDTHPSLIGGVRLLMRDAWDAAVAAERERWVWGIVTVQDEDEINGVPVVYLSDGRRCMPYREGT